MNKKIKAFDVFNVIFFIVVTFICVFPIYLIAANAFSTESDVLTYGFAVFPKNFTFDAFKYVLKEPSQLLNSLWATLVYAIGGTAFSVLIMAMLGYVLTRKEFIFKKICNVALVFTMFFSAGLIPSYIVNTQMLHLENSWMAYILIHSVVASNVFIYRTFFRQIPESLIESAEIDGATQYQVLAKIIIPLSKAILATQFFLTMSGRWKAYDVSLYYISDPKMYTLEYYIQVLSKNANLLKQSLMVMGMDASEIPIETMKFAVVFFTLIPMVLIFPYFQKKFSKGAMVGAVKG